TSPRGITGMPAPGTGLSSSRPSQSGGQRSMASRSKPVIRNEAAIRLGLLGGIALQHDSGPDGTPPPPESGKPDPGQLVLGNPGGERVASATISEGNTGTTFAIRTNNDSGLAPSKHSVHIHEFRTCDAAGTQPFASAGGHLDPTDKKHGKAN